MKTLLISFTTCMTSGLAILVSFRMDQSYAGLVISAVLLSLFFGYLFYSSKKRHQRRMQEKLFTEWMRSRSQSRFY